MDFKLLLKAIFVLICYFGYVIIFLKILKNKIHTYIDKPEVLLVIGVAVPLGVFGGFFVINFFDLVFTKILGG